MSKKTNDIFDHPKLAFLEYAKSHFDGHYTVMRFTTNYRACFGTLAPLDIDQFNFLVEDMASGKSREEAMRNALEREVFGYYSKEKREQRFKLYLERIGYDEIRAVNESKMLV